MKKLTTTVFAALIALTLSMPAWAQAQKDTKAASTQTKDDAKKESKKGTKKAAKKKETKKDTSTTEKKASDKK